MRSFERHLKAKLFCNALMAQAEDFVAEIVRAFFREIRKRVAMPIKLEDFLPAAQRRRKTAQFSNTIARGSGIFYAQSSRCLAHYHAQSLAQ